MSSQSIDRRTLLRTSLGAAAGAALATSCGNSNTTEGESTSADPNALPDGVDGDAAIVHGRTPWTIETKRGELGSVVTPLDKVFVRGNLPFPDSSVLTNRGGWNVEVAGVAKPGSITVDELKRIGRTSVVAVLQCSGNGRAFFDHGASGTQWSTGAAANVIWTGVPVRDVLEAFGGATGDAKFLTGTGGEPLPEGLDERQVVVERSVPIEKALQDGLLAWELNGEPLPLSHGGPLRLVIPGYYGVNHVKYVKRLAPTAAESDAKIQVSSYRVRPIGEKGTPAYPSMWDMNVKSWIEDPIGGGSMKAGRQWVTGVAFSGGSPITSVEVTTDGGATWAAAELVGPDLGPFAWRTFAFPWDASTGQHVLASRATDAAGNTQPKDRVENERGYAHNGWSDPSVAVTVA